MNEIPEQREIVFLRKISLDRTFSNRDELASFLRSQNPYVTFEDLCEEKGMDMPLALYLHTQEFIETGNPILAVEIMALSDFLELYPPTGVIKWLGKAFRAYMKGSAEEGGSAFQGDIEKLLGLKGEVSGSGAKVELLVEMRNKHLLHMMAILIEIFDLDASKAARLLWARTNKSGEFTHRGGLPGWKSLYDTYRKKNLIPQAIDEDRLFLSEHQRALNFVESFNLPECEGFILKDYQALRSKLLEKFNRPKKVD